MTTTKHHPGARNSVSLEFRATPKTTRQFCAASAAAGRPVTFDDARDVLSDLVSTISNLLGITARSVCRYHLRPGAIGDLATRWAAGALDARREHLWADTQALQGALAQGPGVFIVDQRVDMGDLVVRCAVWNSDLPGPVIELTVQPRAGGSWFAQHIAAELGVTPAPLAQMMGTYRPTLIVRCGAHLSLAAAHALAQAGAGTLWTLVVTGHDAHAAIARGPLAASQAA